MPVPRLSPRRFIAALSGLAVGATAFAVAPVSPAAAEVGGTGLVVHEVYGGGGFAASGSLPASAFQADFVELYNPTDAAVPLAGLSLQYRAATYAAPGGGVQVLALDPAKQVPPGSHYLVQLTTATANGAPLPAPDQTGSINLGAGAGQVLLAEGTTPVTAVGDVKDTPAVLDMVGYGSTPTSFETAPTGTATSGTTSVQRVAASGRAGVDTDVNRADFAAPSTPTPTRSTGDTAAPEPPPAEVEDVSIAQVQGTGATTPRAGDVVRTEGVVTAAYPTGGLNGFVIQTGGTGGAPAGTPRSASDAVFVWGGTDGFDDYPAIGDSVEVTGTATEGGGPATGLTQLVPGADGSWADLDTALPAVQPTAIGSLPASEAAKEALESMLVTSNGTYTVTNVFGANSFAEIGLASGTRPLIQPTEVADAQDTAAVAAVVADNAARRVAVDDGASINYLTGRNRNQPLPWLRADNPIRVGARATVRQPMILEFRNSTWKFQARTRLSAADTAAATTPVTFTDTRPANAAPRAVGGALQLATFNVLNYFPTTGVDWIDRADAACTPFSDRQSNPVTVDECDPEGPRGAWNETNLERQQVKIVRGILGSGAEVLALQEIENSARLGLDRDAAVSRLVDELNAAGGTDAWAFVPSPPASDLPAVADQDVIRNALIYNSDAVRTIGASASLGVDDRFVGSAREPMAQVFRPAGRRSDVADFALIANHFKSKGSGVDDGTGQGNANPNRVAQAEGLSEFADEFAEDRGVEAVFLAGDFNSYTSEDPLQVLYGDGYRKVPSDTPGAEWSYSFSGLSGSLDHVLANDAASATVSGSDYWGINGGESVAFEYSRANYNRTQFLDDSVFRASDHDPQVVGLTPPEDDPVVDLNLLSFNDFHGRINNSTSSDGVATGTAQFAGTVEQLRRNARGGPGSTLLLGNGDIYGASEFTSAINDDVPTFDVMNALRVAGSSVGNHEFDFGFDDLTGRVTGDDNETGEPLVDFPYLGANVYREGTTDPVLPEYETYEVDGVTVAAVGVVTQETPSLVSPTGIEGLEFGNAAEAADRVAAQLSDGDDANGEADVVVVLAHAGGAGFAEDATYADALAATTPDSEFQQLAGLGDDVDAIFNGHTHQVYALRQPGVGAGGRAIVQAGQYGEHVGRVTLSYDRDTGEVTTRSAAVRDRVTTPTATLTEQFPAVAEVQRIVDRAIAAAAVVGNEPVGRISDDVTRARTATGGEDRGEESTLGGLIGNALRDGVALNGLEADLGVVNPGGIRADLVFAGNTAGNPANTDGIVTYAEANSVLPFTNNISLVQLTGAELRTVLEQQFQPAGSDRTYLHLGLSDNVQVTTDRSAPQGERITSVRIDGAPLDPAATYTVSTFSFLAAGGDNFTGFREGEVRDTGLVDRDLWISYLRETSQGDGTEPIDPDQARRQVDETGLPAALAPGETATFTLSRLDMRSLDSPANTAVTARVVSGDSATDLGRVGVVANGTSEVTVTVPTDAPSGAVVELVADPSGTTVTVPVEGDGEPPVDPEPPVDAAPVDPELRASATPDPALRGETVRIVTRVLAERDGKRVPVAGRVVVTRANGDFVGVGQVDDRGRVRVRSSFERRGVVNLVLAFRSADRTQVRDGETTLRLRVR